MTRSSDLVMVERELDQPSIATKQATDETAASVLSEPPEAWADCETCGGEGAINRTIHVYENGCGFSHPDVEIIPCTDCMGTGGAIVDAASTYCDICGGDCSSANPPVFNCPLAKQESRKERARGRVRDAIRHGKMVKPTVCECCKTETPAHLLDGHHHDYDKPLEVRWLCRSCHGLESLGVNHAK